MNPIRTVISAIALLLVALLAAMPDVTAAATQPTCYTCTPQCVPAARTWSGVNFPRVEYAKGIPAAARKAKFNVASSPPLNKKSAAVIALGAVDHAIAVTKASKSGSKTNLEISHANFDCKCSVESVRATFAAGKITFISGALKGRSFAVRAFVW